jgi:hypothetical protein
MGHRSTSIAFLIAMLLVAAVWLLYKDARWAPNRGGRPTKGSSTLTGRVLDAATGEPLREFDGTICSKDGGPCRLLRVSGDGRFLAGPLPEGRYVITIHSKNAGTATVEGVAVTGKVEPPEVVIKLGAPSAGEANKATGPEE